MSVRSGRPCHYCGCVPFEYVNTRVLGEWIHTCMSCAIERGIQGHAGWPTPSHRESEEASPLQQDHIRAMEDGE